MLLKLYKQHEERSTQHNLTSQLLPVAAVNDYNEFSPQQNLGLTEQALLQSQYADFTKNNYSKFTINDASVSSNKRLLDVALGEALLSDRKDPMTNRMSTT